LIVHEAVAQVVPQLVSVLIVFSQPLAALASQSWVPAAQAVHAPAVQVWPVVQTECAQPQFASVLVFSQPLAALASQSCVPVAHAAHEPAVHV
jgi:hypothetical protein